MAQRARLFMIRFLFPTVSLSQNHLKALSLSTHDFTSLTPIHSCFTSSPLPAGSTAQSSPSASHPPRLVLAGGFLLPL